MLQPAAVFSNHMVLQREKNITIWGKTDSKEEITVAMHNQVVKALIQGDQFEATFLPMEAGGPYDVIIRQGKEVVRFLDVLVGEVWYAGGQSNMELALANSLNGSEVVANMENDKIRFYQVQRKSFFDDAFYESEKQTNWEVCEKGACGEWSAVATYFAQYLQNKLGIAVGIIGCNLGGTSASCWTSRERLETDKDTHQYIETYDKAMEGKTIEEYEKELKEYNEWYPAWQKKVDELYREDPDITWTKVQEIAGESRWPEPLGPKSPFRPGGLHETMTMRVSGYALRGAIYYQGEDDVEKASYYNKTLRMVIEQFREDWQDESLPFLIVQLPRHIFKQEADLGKWALLRKQQMNVHKTVANTGIAVMIDKGEFNNIHPLEKSEVGRRLALQAMQHVYHLPVKAYGPMYEKASILEDKVIIQACNVEGSLQYRDDEFYASTRKDYCPIDRVTDVISETGFEVAGLDGVFYPASVELEDSMIYLTSKQVKEIIWVRYAYHDFSPVTVFDQAGLPLAPFCEKIRGLKLF